MAADVDTLRGETVAGVAMRSGEQLRAALRDIREERSPAYLARAVVLALIATLLFAALLVALVHVRARGHVWVARVRAGRRTAEGQAEALSIPMSQLRGLIDRGVGLLTLAAAAFAAYMWIAYVLAQFPFSRPWGEALGGYLTASISRLALSTVRAIPGLFTVLLIFIATRWVAGAVSAAFNAAALGRLKIPGVHAETAVATRRIVIVLVWLFGLMVAYPNIPGSDSDAFKGISVFAGLVFTLGSSGLVSQAMSGLVVLYSRAYRPGDFVRIGDAIEGRITRIGMLSTKLRNLKREEITLPNSVVLGAQVTNFSRLRDEGGPLLHTTVSVGYDAPWRQVEALLLLAARRTDGLSVDEPPAFVLRTALSDFAVKYQLNARLVDPGRRALTLSALHGHILDAFNEYGVQIVVPNYEGDPERSKVVPRERWYAAPAVAQGVEVDGAEVRR
jgi:small-conductance mechanosensitive channel